MNRSEHNAKACVTGLGLSSKHIRRHVGMGRERPDTHLESCNCSSEHMKIVVGGPQTHGYEVCRRTVGMGVENTRGGSLPSRGSMTKMSHFVIIRSKIRMVADP